MYEVLSDEDWHSMHDVVTEMCKKIPPGTASRSNGGADADASRTVRVRTSDAQAVILKGQRRIALDSVRTAAKAGLLEIDVSGGESQVKVRLAERLRQWDTARLAAHLGRAQSTVQSWFADPETVKLVQAQLPKGVPAVIPDPFGGRKRTTPAEAIPAWEKFANGRRVFVPSHGEEAHAGELTAAVQKALDLDERAAVAALRRLQEELAAGGYRIFRKSA
jgi:hypothetical protein